VKVLVYPHVMEIGGSQLNAIEIAAAVRNRGHEVVIVSEPGPLLETVRELGLEHLPLPLNRRRPSAGVSLVLSRIVRKRGINIVHGYEWPPGVEAFLGPRLCLGVPVVCTVMSAVVAPFLPKGIALMVGTEEIRQRAILAGYKRVTLLEPPVNTLTNSPECDAGDFRSRYGLDPAAPLVVIVSRLARELKLEGLMAACRTVGGLVQDGIPVQLAIVGDGPERAEVERCANEANGAAGRRAVVLTGQLADPGPAYASADIVLGMGGSALRGMAFSKPLVVQGERGFWRLCTPSNLGLFLSGGWYGVGEGGDGAVALRAELSPLLGDRQRRLALGDFGRQLVLGRFSLDQAGILQEQIYLAEVASKSYGVAADLARTSSGLLAYKLRRKLEKFRGVASRDDFNAIGAQR
jgi:glycosyltransferase involved in cell wall biosynthesis